MRHDHLAAQVLKVIGGRDGEVAFLVARPVAEVVLFAARVPAAFIGIDEVEAVLRLGIEANAIEDEELGFGAEEGLVGDAAAPQVHLGLDGDPARIALVRFACVIGSPTSQIITSVGVSRNGSMKAVFGSGISSMSDS